MMEVLCDTLLYRVCVIPDKTKFADAEPGEGASHCFTEECATPSAVVKPLQADDPGSLLSQ